MLAYVILDDIIEDIVLSNLVQNKKNFYSLPGTRNHGKI